MYIGRIGMSVSLFWNCSQTTLFTKPCVNDNVQKPTHRRPKLVLPVAKKHFHPDKDPNLAEYLDEKEYERVVRDKKRMEDLFTKLLLEHVQEAAWIVGMTQKLDGGHETAVVDTAGVVASLKKNPDVSNVKKACFIYHFASDNAYQAVFRKGMFEYHEQRFMDQLKVKYCTDGPSKKGGCVQKLGSRMMNKMRVALKNALEGNVSFVTNLRGARKGASGEKNIGGKNYIYYICVKGEDMVKVSYRR